MTEWDCIVVGGGAAGLSAALVLGRARRRTLLVDAGAQSNLAAEGVGGLLGHEGRPPSELYAAARRELAGLPTVEVRDGEVAGGERTAAGFVLEVGDGAREQARRVLLATGMEYRYPQLPGVADRWGRSVFHCPFCHGWEVRDRRLAVIGGGASGLHRSLLLRSWSDDVTLLSDGPVGLEPQDVDRLRAAGVAIDERAVASVRGTGEDVEAVIFEDGDEHACGGVLVPVELHQRTRLIADLGVATVERLPIAPEAIEVDGSFQTSVAGVYAAGDVCVQMPSVAAAIGSGHAAAAQIVAGLATQPR